MKKMITCMILMAILCVGCSENGSDAQDKNTVSGSTKAVLESMLNCPNEKLYNSSAITAIGEGTSEEESEDAQVSVDEQKANWKDAVGEYFTDDSFEKFYNEVATWYLGQADAIGDTWSLGNIELKEKGDNTELVETTVKTGKGDKTISLMFTYDSDGKIQKVEEK